jgi:tetratricopeptide (TPR) repeat protein
MTARAPAARAAVWLAVPALVLAVVAVERTWTPGAAPALPHIPAAARTIQIPADAPRTFDQALARAERDLANAQARAAQHPGEWVMLEGLARRYVARARLTGSYDDYAAAQATLDRAFALAPPRAGPHLTQASLDFTMHRLGRAERMLDAIDAYAVPPDFEERVEALAMRGDIAFYRGDYGRAAELYGRVDKLEPGPGTAFRWAVYHTKTGRLDLAGRYFDAAVRASRMALPQFRANVELQKGTLELERGRWDAALSRFRAADAIFPGHWLIQEHIAEALVLKGETAAAERLYADIVRRTGNPEYMDALAALASVRGDAAAARAWRGRAGAEWDRRMRLFPEAAYGHALAHALDVRDTGRALDLARRNVQARPYGDALVMLAQAQLRAGDVAGARATIERVVATPWNTAQLHGVASQVFAAAGEEGMAARERTVALSMNPHELDDPANPRRPSN